MGFGARGQKKRVKRVEKRGKKVKGLKIEYKGFKERSAPF
jgi:hypothetical protein